MRNGKFFKAFVSLLLCVLLVSAAPSAFAVQQDGISASGTPVYVEYSREKAVWLDGCPKPGTTEIDAVKWYLDDDGIYYFFMPSSADLSSVVLYHNFGTLSINGKTVSSGDKLSDLKKNETMEFNADGKACKVKIMQSSKVASLFLTTESGSMSNINSDPIHEYSESGQLLLIDSDGSVSYDGELSSIKGRGNTTWRNIAKKPYNIKLPSKASLLGMKASKKWCLLANGQEHSLLRNRVVYDLADEVGLDYSPESRFMDVYANGEYLGSYQMTEKVELGKNNLVSITDLQGNTEDALQAAGYNSDIESYRVKSEGNRWGGRSGYELPLNPDDITGGYLIEYVAGPEENCHFVTNSGQSVDLKTAASIEQVNYIADFVQDMEDALYSPTGYNSKGKHYSEYIDVESAALMYLIEELSVNIDAGISSCFFYKDSDSNGDGKLHAAPVWDYDVAFGNLSTYKDGVNMMDTDSIFAAESRQYGNNQYTIIAQFAHQPEILQTAEKLWSERFVPAFNILNGKAQGTGRLKSFSEYSSIINASAQMNFTRWDISDNLLVPQAGTIFESQRDYYLDWMARRESFMNMMFMSVDAAKKVALAELERYKNLFDENEYDESVWNNFIKAYQRGVSAVNSAQTSVVVQSALSMAKIEMKRVLGDMYVYFDNSKTKWSEVYVYWWGTNDAPKWYGFLMEYCGNDIWRYKVSPDVTDILFNDGKQTSQTADLIFPGEPNKLFVPDFDNPSSDKSKGIVYKGDWTNYKTTGVSLGDVDLNGTITIADAILLQKHIAEITILSGDSFTAADVDKNGEITIADAIILQKHIASIELIA